MPSRSVVIALLLAMAAAIFTSSPAGAEPEIYVGVVRPAGVAGPESIVYLSAPAGSWQIRQAARRMDAAVDGLTIRTGACQSDGLCVRVEMGPYTAEEQLALSQGVEDAWAGLTTYPAPLERVVYLKTTTNPSRMWRRHVAAHELGHALGLAHTGSRRGVMSHHDDQFVLSAAEIRVLEAWFAVPRYAGA